MQKNSLAQQNLLLSKRQAIGLNFHYGFVVQHKLVSDHLITQHIPGVDLLIQKHSTGAEWQYRYRLPYFGYMLSYYNLGDGRTIGNALAALYHVDFRLKYNQKKDGINFRAGAGIGYVTQRFDIRDNYKNTLIGSRLNTAFKFQLDFYRYITWLNKISLGFSFIHFSNGAFQVPNAGINIAGVNLSYTRSFGKIQSIRTFDPPDFKKGFTWYAWIGGFLKQISPYLSPKQPALSFQTVYAYQPLQKQNMGAAFDVMFDPTVETRVRNASFATKPTTSLRVGVGAHYEQIFGRMSIPVQLMYYLRNDFPEDGNLYQRIGVRYFNRSGWIYNATLKTHAAKADYLEFGIGKRIK